MFNQCTFIGRLTANPDHKYIEQLQAPVCNFTIAVARKYNKDETDFIDIETWNKLADICNEHLKKGRLVCVTGELQIKPYEKDGVKRKIAKIVAEEVKFLDKAN